MLIANTKPIMIIGFAKSAMTEEIYQGIIRALPGRPDIPQSVTIIPPKEFLELEHKDSYQFATAFTLDVNLRKKVIGVIDELNLDCVSYIHDSVIYYNDMTTIGKDCFIAPHTVMLLGSKIGSHCIIETNCLVAHYAELEDNVILHAGTMIAGKTKVCKHTVFNFKAAAVNALVIGSDIEVGASSTVTKNIQDPGVYVGTPARRLRDRINFEDKHDF